MIDEKDKKGILRELENRFNAIIDRLNQLEKKINEIKEKFEK